MTNDNKLNFYKTLGKAINIRRITMGFTIASLAREADEQYNTIKSIEEGKPFSMHHAVWLKNVLDFDIYYHQGEENNDKFTIDDLV